MDSHGRLFEKGEPSSPSALLAAYYRLVDEGFSNLARFSEEELAWLQKIHDKHLDFYREERRMHFGAFALVSLAVIIILPAVLTIEEYFLPLAGVLALLLVLLAPYTFVYWRYEEGVRKKMRESMILENARRARDEARAQSIDRE